jgi:hypothetical protein
LTEALQTIISQFKTLSPDIASTVVFKLDGETLAASEGALPEQTHMLIACLNDLTHTGCIGGLENLSVQDINSQVSVAAVGDVYLATVSSRMGDQKVIKSLTQVVAPTAIQLALKMPNATITMETPKINPKIAIQQIEEALPKKEQTETPVPQEPETQPNQLPPQALSTQFMVEKIGGLLVASDTVRIDGRVLSDWQDAYGKHFTAVRIETLERKTVTCKFKPQKDCKGTIGIPDRILQALECDKGKLVMVKPVLE